MTTLHSPAPPTSETRRGQAPAPFGWPGVRFMARRALGAALVFSGTTGPAWAQTPQPPLPTADMLRLAAAFAKLRDGFVSPVTGESLMAAALRGMLREIDPDGGEYHPDLELRQSRDGADSAKGQIGALVVPRNGRLLLLPTAGGAADAAGVQPRDVLLAVNDQPVTGLDTQQVTRLLTGSPGSEVQLTLLRGLAATPLTVAVKRAPVQPVRSSAQRHAGGALVLKPSAFNERTLDDVADLLFREWRQQRYSGVVLDLRRHTGGLLSVAVGLAALFLPADALVAKTVGRQPESNQSYRAHREFYGRRLVPDPLVGVPAEVRALPLVVLVDEGTASGAELVAAALKDHRRARLLGRRTFGRGSIQTIVPMPGGGAIQFTTAHWESPAGQRVGPAGVEPDEVLDTADAAQEVEAAAAALVAQPAAARP